MLNLAEGDQIRGTTSVCPCLTARAFAGAVAKVYNCDTQTL